MLMQCRQMDEGGSKSRGLGMVMAPDESQFNQCYVVNLGQIFRISILFI